MTDVIRGVLAALVIVVGSIALAYSAQWALRNLFKHFVKKTASVLDNVVIRVVEKPLMLSIVVIGLYGAVLGRFAGGYTDPVEQPSTTSPDNSRSELSSRPARTVQQFGAHRE